MPTKSCRRSFFPFWPRASERFSDSSQGHLWVTASYRSPPNLRHPFLESTPKSTSLTTACFFVVRSRTHFGNSDFTTSDPGRELDFQAAIPLVRCLSPSHSLPASRAIIHFWSSFLLIKPTALPLSNHRCGSARGGGPSRFPDRGFPLFSFFRRFSLTRRRSGCLVIKFMGLFFARTRS